MSLYGDGLQRGVRLNQLTAIEPCGRLRGHSVWLFKCYCGKQVTLRAEAVRRGNNVCCGAKECLLRHKTQRCPDPELGARNYVLRYYRNSAKERGYEFTLTEEECLSYFKGNCHYCGEVPSGISRPRKTRAPFIYSGIDRLDNSLGYVAGNCVSCCKTCNIMKQALSVDGFLQHIFKICEHSFEE